jgi:hypothetical protein
MTEGPVAKKLWLHIGTEKTGTKTIQSVGHLNRARLIQDGILYPKTPGRINHVRLALFARENTPNLRRRADLFSTDRYHEFRSGFVRELRDEIKESRCHTVYLSNEMLGIRIRRPRDFRRLADAMRSLAEAVNVIVYLRPQHDLFVSLYSTKLRTGSTEPLAPPTDPDHRRYNYETRLSGWADAFGEENIRVRIFDRKSFLGGDLIKDFFSVLGCLPSWELEIPHDQNRSLDADAIEFLRIFNKYVSKYTDEALNPARGYVGKALEEISRGNKLHVPQEILRSIAALFEASNARVAARYLNRRDGKLFDNLNFNVAPESQPLTIERAIEIAAHLWEWGQQRINERKRRRLS